MLTFRHRRQQQASLVTVSTAAVANNLINSPVPSSSSNLVGGPNPVPTVLPLLLPQAKRKQNISNAKQKNDNTLLHMQRRFRNSGSLQYSVDKVEGKAGSLGSSSKQTLSYKRKRINSSYSRVKRIHRAREATESGDNCELESESESNSADDDDDDLSTDSDHSGYAESNEDKEASCDEQKSSTRYHIIQFFLKRLEFLN